MRLKGLQVNNNKYIRNVPSIYAGDWFWYNFEMFIIGLHKQLEVGMTFISKMKLPFGISLATSIVIKQFGNPYKNDRDCGEFITHNGQGGLSTRSSTTHNVANQVLSQGNETLKNSYEGHQMVQVIRGHKDKESPTSEFYTYLGLYYIMCMRHELGKMGTWSTCLILNVKKVKIHSLHVHPNLKYILPI